MAFAVALLATAPATMEKMACFSLLVFVVILLVLLLAVSSV